MRTPGLAAITMAFAIAACSDVAAPIAAGPDTPSLQASRSAWDVLRNGWQRLGDKQKCDDNATDPRLSQRDHFFRFGHWGWRGHQPRLWGWHDHADRDKDCGGGVTTATISGTVTNDGTPAAGYSVFLLKGDGSAVVATVATDTTGAYTFAAVQAGAYLVCEDNPFTEAHTFLGETRPQTGGACPAAYAPIGFSLTAAAGATLSGNAFSNMRLD